MQDSKAILPVIEQLYAAAASPEEWTPALESVVSLFRAGHAVLHISSLNGVASITRSVGQSGVYVIKVVNVGVGPVQVWTATTPYLAR